jgi:transposase-like protein
MSNQRYTPEFKDEAVRQVVERGYSVAEVAERLGVSARSPQPATRNQSSQNLAGSPIQALAKQSKMSKW